MVAQRFRRYFARQRSARGAGARDQRRPVLRQRRATVTAWMTALAGLVAILAAAASVWLLSVRLRDVSIADVCWGSGFTFLAWLYCVLSPASTPRSWLVAILISVWGVRLSLHIFRRNHGKGEDPRYRAMRASHGPAFWWRSLFTVFLLQGAILWFVALPVLVAVRAPRPAGLTAVDGAGIVLFAIGFGFEVVGDAQLARFKSDPGNHGRVLDRGLWRYTRHPNYFGDATLWWGVYAIACATPGGWLTVLSPALMSFLLVRVSGVTLLEEGLKQSRPGYRQYISRTPAFFPWFPRVR
jgi:steroid 5-alpha reductase family enzyme